MNYLVTGISRGLGFTVARVLLEDGHTVYGVSRTISSELEELLKMFPGKIYLKSIDLHNPDSVKESMFSDFLGYDIPIHGFVNNAAIAYDDIITNLDYLMLEKMFRVNVFTPMMITKNVIRNMLLHGTRGSIVHVSSISVHTGYKGLAMYAASKGALEAFSKNSAREWGVRGIRSNCLVAGFMETSMSASLSAEQKDRIYKRTSLKEPTDINSVSKTIAYLVSDNAVSITGQNIFVDSGTI